MIVIIILYIVIFIVISLIVVRVYMRFSIRKYVSNTCMIGKMVIVTGANSGIGFETAKDLAGRGARVILACRNEGRGLSARDKIISDTKNSNVVYKQLDLSSLDSVRNFAEDINRTEKRLDVLVNNAGVVGHGDRFTDDGILEGMQINYFAPFLLTLLLLPLLKKSRPSRIVNVASIAHFAGNVKLDYIIRKGYYSSFSIYANSKLCQMIFTVELARRLKDTGVIVNAVHPGLVDTNIMANMGFFTEVTFKFMCWLCGRSALEGAQTVVYLSVAEEVANVSGKYYVDCKQGFMSWKASNKITATNLWYYSMKLIRYNENLSI